MLEVLTLVQDAAVAYVELWRMCATTGARRHS